MNLNSKKVIAREFIVLIACGLIAFVVWLIALMYNQFIHNEILKLNISKKEIQKVSDQKEKSFVFKINEQKRFHKISQWKGWHTDNRSYSKLWQRVENLIKSDSLQYRWENEWGQEFKDDSEKHFHISNSDDFINYIRRYSLTEKEKKVLIEGENQIEKINDKIKSAENKFVDYFMADQPPSIFLIIFLIIAFPLRFIFYALKWSIKTLRQ
jgi:hypothetical protein